MREWTFATLRFEAQLLAEQDRELYASLYTDASVMAHIAPPLTRDVALAAFTRVCRANVHLPWRVRTWRLRHRESRLEVGILALSRGAHDPTSAEIGIMLLPTWQARGVTREVLRVLIDTVMRDDWQLGVLELIGRHDAGNRAARLVRWLGFQQSTDSSGYIEWRLTQSQWLASLAAPDASGSIDG